MWPPGACALCGPFLGFSKVTQTQAFSSAWGSKSLQTMRPWSRGPSARVAESGINLLEPSYNSQNINCAPYPLQLLMRNKGIKRDRNVLSFGQSWGNHNSFTAVKLRSESVRLPWRYKLAAWLEKETERARASGRIISPSLQSSNSCRPLGLVALSKLSGWKQDRFP